MSETKTVTSPVVEELPSQLPKKTKTRGRTALDYPIVQIDWADHNTHGDWVSDADIDGAAIIVKTAGWLVRENAETITVASGVAKESSHPYLNITTILKATIKKRVLLRG